MTSDEHRGHAMYFDEQVWRYIDDDSLVGENHDKRPCGNCGELTTELGHDPCIANLAGVKNACCGHGQDSEAYVQFASGRHIQGRAAVVFFTELAKGE